MAFRCGFYNAVNHDRTYNANEFGDLFTGLINDGVYATVGHAMTVAPVSGMTVKVRSGRAWFNKTWNVNDSDYPLNIPASDLLLPRIDAVILEVDTRLAVRDNSLKIVTGRPENNPTYPKLTRSNGLYQYPLAYVTVNANARNITSADIEVVVGRDPTPFVTGIVGVADISDFWEQWDAEFHIWFDELRTNMSGDVAQNLQAQIEQLKVDMITVDNKASTSQAQSGSSDSVWMTPAKTLAFYNYRLATKTEATAANNNSNIMTPLRVGDFFMSKLWGGGGVSSSDIVSSSRLAEYIIACAATDSEVSAGYPDNKYVSPKTLKTALSSFSPSGGGSTPTSSSGTGTVSGHSGVSLGDVSTVRYLKFGPITLMHYVIEFSVTSNSLHNVGFTIRGLPAPTEDFIDQGILRRYSGSTSETPLYRFLCSIDSSNYINAIVEFHGNGSATAFQTGITYAISGDVAYY